jgi:hypothetical protein
MDREQLALWNTSVIPIVTALASAGASLPAHMLGYRSPTRTIDVAADRRLKGPILVVLPMAHPSRVSNARPALPASAVVHRDTIS